ncbi:MAG: hypothetical protein AB1Z67_07905 [Candidatus Limnocylindrales bacterium]
METVLEWFDLSAGSSDFVPAASQPIGLVQQVLLYLVVVLGVIVSEAVAMARSGGPVRIELNRPWLVVACVVALVVFPAVWHELGAMAEAGLLVQMGIAAQGGVFWGVVVAGAEKGVAG